MSRVTALRRYLVGLVSLSAVALLLTAGLPHQHDGSVATHPSPSCRLCKLHEGFSAAPESPTAIQPLEGVAIPWRPPAAPVPQAADFAGLHAPRAPPALDRA